MAAILNDWSELYDALIDMVLKIKKTFNGQSVLELLLQIYWFTDLI